MNIDIQKESCVVTENNLKIITDLIRYRLGISLNQAKELLNKHIQTIKDGEDTRYSIDLKEVFEDYNESSLKESEVPDIETVRIPIKNNNLNKSGLTTFESGLTILITPEFKRAIMITMKINSGISYDEARDLLIIKYLDSKKHSLNAKGLYKDLKIEDNNEVINENNQETVNDTYNFEVAIEIIMNGKENTTYEEARKLLFKNYFVKKLVKYNNFEVNAYVIDLDKIRKDYPNNPKLS